MNAAPINHQLLIHICETSDNQGFAQCAETAELQALYQAGFVLVNFANRSPEGMLPTVITDEGRAYLATIENSPAVIPANEQVAANAPAAPSTPGVSIGVMPKPEPPKRTRVVVNKPASKYPFDKLELPNPDGTVHFFRVEPTEKMPKPAKSLGSSVSQAQRKYGRVIGLDDKGRKVYELTRVFRVVPADDGSGAAIVYRDHDAEPGNNADKVVSPL